MTWLDFVALILATGTPINAWLYEQSILAGWREWVHAWGDTGEEDTRFRPRLRDRIRFRLAELATCRFCLSHWVPVILIGAFFVPSMFLIEPWNIIMKLPIYSLAITRGALCLSTVMRRFRRPPDLDPLIMMENDNQE
jgi:hypothetical protein